MSKPSGFGWFSHRKTDAEAGAEEAVAPHNHGEAQALMDHALARLAQAVDGTAIIPLYTIEYEAAQPKPGHILPFIARLDYGPLPACFQGASVVDGMAFNLERAKAYIPFIAAFASQPTGAVAYCWARMLPPMIYANRKRNRVALTPVAAGEAPRLVAIIDFTHRADDVHYDISKAMGRVICAIGVNHPFTKIECWGCERTFETRLVKCSLCRVARYCSKACQRAHWFAGHRNDCAQMGVVVVTPAAALALAAAEDPKD